MKAHEREPLEKLVTEMLAKHPRPLGKPEDEWVRFIRDEALTALRKKAS